MKFQSQKLKTYWENQSSTPLKSETETIANDLEALISEQNLDNISWELYQEVHRKYFPDFLSRDYFMVGIWLSNYWLYKDYRDTENFPHFPQDFNEEATEFNAGVLTLVEVAA